MIRASSHKFLTLGAFALSLALTGCLTDDDGGDDNGNNGDPVSSEEITVGAQNNATHGSSIDLDGFNVYKVAEAKTRTGDIDLIFGNSTATVGGAVAIFSPDVAKNGINGSDGFDFMQSGWATANTTIIKTVTVNEINAITNTDQIDSLWNAGSVVSNGRLPVANGTTFMAQSNLNKKVLVRVTGVSQGNDGSAMLTGIAKF
jgi:hypothetical protein